MEITNALGAIIGTSADAATVVIAAVLLRIERRVYKLELATGIRRLISR